MDGTIDPETDYLASLSGEVGRSWPTLTSARDAANDVRVSLSQSLSDQLASISSVDTADTDVIVFGSLARQEWTSGSDVDWTLLIDGQAVPEHKDAAQRVRDTIKVTKYRGVTLQEPGTEGVFGNMAFSHEIIHCIGGQADTNRNTTQRILMLLEAFPLRREDHAGGMGPYERVARHILYRYLVDDTNFASRDNTGSRAHSRIPRFLLNDIVRFWRTMCVDFAYKAWEQSGDKWALRNIKLRMSRKLLFVSGLLTVFSCYKNGDLALDSQREKGYVSMMQDHLMCFARATPLNILIWTLQQLGLAEQACQMLDCYEQFLEKIDDDTVRTHLKDIAPQAVYEDERFLEIRGISHRFQEALNAVFFEADTELRDFTTTYGVF